MFAAQKCSRIPGTPWCYEILAGFNRGEKFLLAIVLVNGDRHEGPFYVRQPFEGGRREARYEAGELLRWWLADEAMGRPLAGLQCRPARSIIES